MCVICERIALMICITQGWSFWERHHKNFDNQISYFWSGRNQCMCQFFAPSFPWVQSMTHIPISTATTFLRRGKVKCFWIHLILSVADTILHYFPCHVCFMLQCALLSFYTSESLCHLITVMARLRKTFPVLVFGLMALQILTTYIITNKCFPAVSSTKWQNLDIRVHQCSYEIHIHCVVLIYWMRMMTKVRFRYTPISTDELEQASKCNSYQHLLG